MERIKFAVIGAGIVGILTALELKKKYVCDVVLFEKGHHFGDQTSGHNSGVIHSGIYYKKNSLKHILCISGNQIWQNLSRDHEIPLKKVGKFIYSQNGQLKDLEGLLKKGFDNKIGEIRWATDEELDRLDNIVNAENAIWIGETRIIDQPIAMRKLLDEFQRIGGIYLKNHELSGITIIDDYFELKFNEGIIVQVNTLINCAGLDAVKLRKCLNLNDYENFFVKGNYLRLNKKLNVENLIYPIPDFNLKGLGVHLTLDFSNVIKFGPNTEDVDFVDYKINEEKLVSMKDFILKNYKGFEEKDLSVDYCGIRPKIKRNGSLVEDFVIQMPLKNYIECLGIESPGFTAAPAISQYILKNFIG